MGLYRVCRPATSFHGAFQESRVPRPKDSIARHVYQEAGNACALQISYLTSTNEAWELKERRG